MLNSQEGYCIVFKIIILNDIAEKVTSVGCHFIGFTRLLTTYEYGVITIHCRKKGHNF